MGVPDRGSAASAVRGASQWSLRWVVVTVACVFGPYVVGGMRTEQVALYGSAVAGVLIYRRHLGALRAGWLVLTLWAVYAGAAAAGALFIESRLSWGSGSVVAGLDNALLPLATLSVVALWMRLIPVPVLLRTVSWMVVGAMALNGALALVTSFVGFDGVPFLSRFWSAGGSGVPVAELAAGSGRYSGIFNQPAEAGVAYSLAAFCLVYLVRSGTSVPRKAWLAAWALIILGGLLTLSKIFVVGGVFIAAGLILTGRPHRVLLSASAIATTVIVVGLGSLGWLGTWGASGTVGWYVDSIRAGDSLAYTASAGRFGEPGERRATMQESDISEEASPAADDPGIPDEFEQPGGLIDLGREVLGQNPWFGLGAGGAPVSYDSTWIEAIIVAGSVGGVCVLSVHVALLVGWIRLRRGLPREEWKLGGAVLILTWGASFGLPSLTGNRESSLVWVFLSLLIVFRVAGDATSRGDAGVPGAASGRRIR
jgi:hypothetical protein